MEKISKIKIFHSRKLNILENEVNKFIRKNKIINSSVNFQTEKINDSIVFIIVLTYN